MELQAAIWYRKSKKSWTEWQEFKQKSFKFFRHIRYLERLNEKCVKHINWKEKSLKTTRYACRIWSDLAQQKKIIEIVGGNYQLFFGNRVCKDLTEIISLGERFEDISVIALERNIRETCLRCAQPGHFTRDCNNQKVPFCWDCGRPGVLTENCCWQNTRQHTSKMYDSEWDDKRKETPMLCKVKNYKCDQKQHGSLPNLRRPVDNRNCRQGGHQKYFRKRYNRFDAPYNKYWCEM